MRELELYPDFRTNACCTLFIVNHVKSGDVSRLLWIREDDSMLDHRQNDYIDLMFVIFVNRLI